MKDIQQLTTLLKELDDQLVTCMRCGMCQSVCPVFNETMLEGDVARGKIALLDSLAKKMVTDAKGVKARLDKCLLCGSCSANCPSGVRVTDIFIKARAILTSYMGLSPVKRAIFRGTLSHPKLFTALIDLGSRFQDAMTTPANAFFGTSCSAAMSPLIGDRHIIPMAKTPLHKKISAINTNPGKSGLKAAFYPGCVVDKVYPGVGDAALKIFSHHGVGVFMPKDQGCCGIPALASGDTKTFGKLFSYNMRLFGQGGFDVLVTPCATCTSTIKKVWPLMAEELDLPQKREAEELAEKTMDISQFLVDRLGVSETDCAGFGKRRKITYHDPCHLGKSLGVYSQPRTVLKAGGKYEFVEMTDANVCCGSGGSFNLQHYETSKKIGNRKRENIISTGAEIVCTSCPACMLQMTDMLSQNKDRIEVRHAVEIYADSL